MAVSDEEHEKMRRRFSVSDPIATFELIKHSNRATFTGGRGVSNISSRFLFQTAEYTKWKNSQTSQSLCIFGEAGTGKTFFAVELIRQLYREIESQDRQSQDLPLLLYAFCDASSKNTGMAVNVIKSLIFMSIVQNRSLTEFLVVGERTKKEAKEWDSLTATIPGLFRQFRDMCRRGLPPTVYLIIDGLDKIIYDVARQELLDELSDMLSSSAQAPENASRRRRSSISEFCADAVIMKVLLLSRSDRDIREKLKHVPNIDLNGEKYKENVVTGKRVEFSQILSATARHQGYEPPLEFLLKAYVKKKASNELAWVKLACGELEALDVSNVNIRKVLEDFPSGGQNLFLGILKRVRVPLPGLGLSCTRVDSLSDNL